MLRENGGRSVGMIFTGLQDRREQKEGC